MSRLICSVLGHCIVSRCWRIEASRWIPDLLTKSVLNYILASPSSLSKRGQTGARRCAQTARCGPQATGHSGPFAALALRGRKAQDGLVGLEVGGAAGLCESPLCRESGVGGPLGPGGCRRLLQTPDSVAAQSCGGVPGLRGCPPRRGRQPGSERAAPASGRPEPPFHSPRRPRARASDLRSTRGFNCASYGGAP